MLTDEQVAEEVTLMHGPWVHHDFLPVKLLGRTDDSPNEGLGIMLRDYPGRILLINMLQIRDYAGTPIADIPHLDFETLEDMVRAGWVGD